LENVDILYFEIFCIFLFLDYLRNGVTRRERPDKHQKKIKYF